MIFITVAIVIICIILSTLFLCHVKRRREHPPGPLGFPIFGMFPFQIMEMILSMFVAEVSDAEKFKQRKLKYGPIWSMEFGKQRIVTLSSWDLINEAFVDNAELFSGRPTNPAYKLVSHGKGILLTDGEIWRGHRQLAIKSLRDLGMGKKSLENRINEEANDLVAYLDQCSSEPVNILNALTKGVSNVIIRLVFDERDDYDDSKLEIYANNLRILAHSDSGSRQASLSPALFQTWIMKRLFPDAHKFMEASMYCNQFIRDKCLTKIQSYNKEDSSECVFDYFLHYRFNESSILSTEDQQEEIIHVIFDLFNAGVDTTSNLLTFCCLMLGRYEDLQDDLRQEIKDVIGDCGQINMEMRKNCPKILSFIDEVHRFCCIAPKIHHRVLNECVFHSYKLNPDDIIFGDFANLFLDPELFENPNEFNAYRFTDQSRSKYNPSKYLIPFGIGKRACLGESIAVMESFLFLVKIIHRFKISLGEETMNKFEDIIRGHSGLVHAPAHHLIVITSI